jgi:hypothetical protein
MGRERHTRQRHLPQGGTGAGAGRRTQHGPGAAHRVAQRCLQMRAAGRVHAAPPFSQVTTGPPAGAHTRPGAHPPRRRRRCTPRPPRPLAPGADPRVVRTGFLRVLVTAAVPPRRHGHRGSPPRRDGRPAAGGVARTARSPKATGPRSMTATPATRPPASAIPPRPSPPPGHRRARRAAPLAGAGLPASHRHDVPAESRFLRVLLLASPLLVPSVRLLQLKVVAGAPTRPRPSSCPACAYASTVHGLSRLRSACSPPVVPPIPTATESARGSAARGRRLRGGSPLDGARPPVPRACHPRRACATRIDNPRGVQGTIGCRGNAVVAGCVRRGRAGAGGLVAARRNSP